MIPKPESHQSQAFFIFFRLKNQKRLRNRSNLVEIKVWPSQNTYFLTPEKMVMTIWPNSLNLGLTLKMFPEISDFFLIVLPFGALYIMVVVVVGGLPKAYESLFFSICFLTPHDLNAFAGRVRAYP